MERSRSHQRQEAKLRTTLIGRGKSILNLPEVVIRVVISFQFQLNFNESSHLNSTLI
jgi:hypothetical protein